MVTASKSAGVILCSKRCATGYVRVSRSHMSISGGTGCRRPHFEDLCAAKLPSDQRTAGSDESWLLSFEDNVY